MDILQNIIRIGTVSSVNPGNGTARVTFAEKSEIVSGDLQVLQRNTLKNKDWALPDVGEQVLCVFLPNGLESGFIIGAVYSAKDKPNEAAKSQDKRRVDFEDGSFVEFDRKTKKLTVDCKGEVILNAQGKITVAGQADLSVTAQGNVMVETQGNAEIKASGSVKIDAPSCEISGPGGTGVVTGMSICHFTGSPHADVSTKVKAGK